MDIVTLEKKYTMLYNLAYKVRHHQLRWFKFKTSVDLDKAKYYERQLDKVLKEEEKAKKTNQQELF